MELKDLKALAEKFRKIADDRAAVNKLADDTAAASGADRNVADLCNDFKTCADGNAVRALADRTKARKN